MGCTLELLNVLADGLVAGITEGAGAAGTEGVETTALFLTFGADIGGSQFCPQVGQMCATTLPQEPQNLPSVAN